MHHSACESRVCMSVVFGSSQSSESELRRRKMPFDVVCACGACDACIGPERRRDVEKKNKAPASQRREGLRAGAQATETGLRSGQTGDRSPSTQSPPSS